MRHDKYLTTFFILKSFTEIQTLDCSSNKTVVSKQKIYLLAWLENLSGQDKHSKLYSN